MSTTTTNKTQNLLSKVIESVVYKSALKKAPRIAKNAKSLLQLLQTALKKTQHLGAGGVFDVIREKVTILGTLIKAYAVGDYRQIEVGNLLKVIAGFVYFIAPIDIIPDILPFIGLSDDVALLMFIFKSIDDELVKFNEWQNRQNDKSLRRN
ncbi:MULTISPECIES: DUF1232 domain-containing protein [Emticicia]|uniref:DUF1232 domain-containing protein n=1 Tax=Emticicia TaxID=312278 RepID=UPI0007D8BBD9|nr:MULTISPECIES: DUF1232 domain-containing protein [Emticicia]